MTDINGIQFVTSRPVTSQCVTIAEVPIDLERDQDIVEIKLRAPGIVRAVGFWAKKPSVLGATSMRAVELVLMPLLFVECHPAGEMQEHVFLLLPSNNPFVPREGFSIRYCATAILERGAGAMHVFEIVRAPV